MASFVGKLLFSIALFFFFLAFIFVIVGFATYWLVPRDDLLDTDPQVLGIGLKQVCFANDFRFEKTYDHDRSPLTGCYDNTRDSAKFISIDEDVWSPRKCTYGFYI